MSPTTTYTLYTHAYGGIYIRARSCLLGQVRPGAVVPCSISILVLYYQLPTNASMALAAAALTKLGSQCYVTIHTLHAFATEKAR